MSAKVPYRTSLPAERGTAGHWVIECVLRGHKGEEFSTVEADYLDKTAPNGIVIDDELVDCAKVVVEDVMAVIREYPDLLPHLLVEWRVPAVGSIPGGIPDIALFNPYLNRLHVWDAKLGRRIVFSYGNLQMIIYANALLRQLGFDGYTEQSVTLDLRIVQPLSFRNSGPVDSWVINASELRGYISQLSMAADRASLHDAPCVTGDHCAQCNAVEICTASRLGDYKLFDYVDFPYATDDMTPRDMRMEYFMLEHAIVKAEARRRALGQLLEHALKDGKGPECGLTLEAKEGRNKWTQSEEKVITMLGAIGVDAHKQGAKTPRQVLDDASPEMKPVLESVLPSMTKRDTTGFKLLKVEDSDSYNAFKRK
jgi:hypothetical protein